jgi:hypothetical protein
MVTIKIPPDNDIARLIREAEESGEPLIIDIGDRTYELDIHAVATASDNEPDAILGIIGLGSSAEPTDISRDKREYLAEAFDSTPK